MPKNKENSYRFAIGFLFKTIKPYKMLYIVATILIFALTGVNLVLAKITQFLIDSVVNNNLHSTLLTGVLYFICIGINTLIVYVNGGCVSKLSAGSGKHLKEMVCHSILHADYRSFEKLEAGDILKTVNEDTDTVCEFIEEDLLGLFSQFIMAFSALLYLLILDPILALVTFAYTPIGMFTTTRINNKMTPLYQIEADQSGKAVSVLEQFLSQIPVVKSFGMERRMREKMYAMYDAQYQTEKEITNWHSMIQTACSATARIPRICFILYAGYLVMNQKMTLGSFSAILELINYFIGPSVYFPFLQNKLNYSVAAMQRIRRICELPVNKKYSIQLDKQTEKNRKKIDKRIDKRNDKRNDKRKDNRIDKKIDMNILTYANEFEKNINKCKKIDLPSLEINNISFCYSTEPVIRNLTYSHKGFGVVAFVGESGCGKSTLLDLISGIYTPDIGTIKLSHPYIILNQEVFIFKTSLYENVRLVRPNATRDEVNEAMNTAGINVLLEELPEGYDTILGDGHRELSGGEKQRIGFARAIVADVPIWIMDEPTSALDEQTEQILCNTIKRFADKKLIILTSHRPKLLEVANERIEIPMLSSQDFMSGKAV